MTYTVKMTLEMVSEGIQIGEDKQARYAIDAVEHCLSLDDANSMYNDLTLSLASGWTKAKGGIVKK